MPARFADRLQWFLIITSSRMPELDAVVSRLARNVFTLAGARPPLTADPLGQLREADRLLAEYVSGQQADTSPAGHAAQSDGVEPSRSSEALIALRDEVLLAARSEHTTAQQVAVRVFEQLGEILEADGLAALPDTGTFDPKLHHVVATRETDDPALAGTVAEVMAPGYTHNGRVVRRQQVVTWRAARRAKVTANPSGPS